MFKILFVEDNKQIRVALTRILRMIPAEVTEADDGTTALEEFEKLRANGEKPDLVVSDMNMLEMNGDELFSQLVSAGLDPKRFVIHSGGMSPNQQRFCAENNVPIITKGRGDPKKLVELIHIYLAT